MKYADVFKMPKVTKIMNRTSSITNSFVNGIIPCITPTEEEIKNVLDILCMEKDNVKCSYCGDTFTEWDHFRPLVRDKRPTGYISEINNLVPACSKCNQSKGNKHWKDWILSDAQLSPKTRNIPDLDKRIEKLESFEKQTHPIKIDFERIVGSELWKKHWDNCAQLHNYMRECQIVSEQIREIISDALSEQKDLTHIAKCNVKFGQPKPNILDRFKQLFQIQQTNKECSANKIENNIAPPHNDDYISSLKEKKVGIIVQNDFKNLLESNILSEYIIEKLQEHEYCKNAFNINFAVLLKVRNGTNISEQRKDHLGRDRYYATPITINGKKYFLSSQWYDRNKEKLIKFMANHSPQAK
ncbi:MAG: HNH endonuclease [Clostridiales bacterium]|nr:HNH endonuclease [Clostridiales bacterium]